jgi:hypothetical protein
VTRLRDLWWNLLATYGARIVGIVAGWIVARLVARGMHVNTELANVVTDMMGTMLLTYALAHRTTSKASNPGDAASGHVAEEEKALKANLLAIEKAERTAEDIGEPDLDPNRDMPGIL